jgi:hypothetical protein
MFKSYLKFEVRFHIQNKNVQNMFLKFEMNFYIKNKRTKQSFKIILFNTVQGDSNNFNKYN